MKNITGHGKDFCKVPYCKGQKCLTQTPTKPTNTHSTHTPLSPYSSPLTESISKKQIEEKGFFDSHTGNDLKPYFFEPEVLLRYDNDPRYDLNFTDYTGYLHSDNKKLLNPEDHIFSQAIGLGYRKNPSTGKEERVICMWLCDLKELSPRHQQYWSSFLIKEDCLINEGFHNQQILAEFNNPTLYDAMLQEMKVINEICTLNQIPPLFNKADPDSRPKEFKLNLLPTKKHFDEFINISDKLLSDNLNMDFFKKQPYQRLDFKTVEGRPKGTLTLLNEFMDKAFKPLDGSKPSDKFKALKEIRDLRNPNSHKISSNEYDYKYHEKQEELIKKVYEAVRMLRLTFMNMPNAREKIKIPDWLYKGEFLFY